MRRFRIVSCLALLAAAVAVVPAVAAGGPPPVAQTPHGNRPVCGPPAAGTAACHARVVTRNPNDPTPAVSASPTGLAPADIATAYAFDTTDPTRGTGKTIAIVDAYDLPSAESDLNTFGTQFGLPVCSGCFQKVNQTGGTTYPAFSSGWGLEIALDIQWAHAIAPGATILLVEATTNSYANLFAAVDYARTHADYISMSWGSGEFSTETAYDSHFPTGKSYFVSAGDAGLPAEYPSSSPNVISVGGTTLHFDGTGTFTGETGWSDGGGGCSVYESKPASQVTGSVNCGTKRATPDVSLDADPASGVSVYDSNYSGQSGWFTVGGTSASAPMWAGRSAVAGVTVNSPYVYGTSIGFRDITVGNNGANCLVGFDLCSGRGSWADNAPPPPPPTKPVSAYTASCSGQTCSFTDRSTNGPTAWSWNFNDGSASTAQNPSHTFGSSARSYVVSLTASNSAGSGNQVTHTIVCSTSRTGKKVRTNCTFQA